MEGQVTNMGVCRVIEESEIRYPDKICANMKDFTYVCGVPKCVCVCVYVCVCIYAHSHICVDVNIYIEGNG